MSDLNGARVAEDAAAMQERIGEALYDGGDDGERDLYLTFLLSGETYGIEIRHVREIVGLQGITEVPDMPVHVRGVINLRGQVIPVMDMRLRFSMQEREYDDRTCIVVVDVVQDTMGLVVDRVDEVVEIREENVSAPPKVRGTESDGLILGMGRIGEEVKILLDAEQVVYAG